ncbi:MAG: zinc-ribbon domain-containing protein [Candidatus Aenigmatarchaeota archaeon]
MFRKKVCSNCGEKIKEEWNFCPYCGEEVGMRRIQERKRAASFESFFGSIDKEFERINKMLLGDFFKLPSFKIRPNIKDGSVSITIRSGTGMKPKVDVRTYGEYKKLEPELKRRLGVTPAIEEVEEEKREVKVSKVTEEPESEIQTVGDKWIISIKLPGVKSKEDIEIKKLEQSIEVKAFADNKTYFTLIPIPNGVITSKKFKNGVLKIEIGR